MVTLVQNVLERTWKVENLASLYGYSVNNVQTFIEGFFVPPATGHYTFAQSSDDYGDLWFTDEADAFCATEFRVASLE